MIKVSAKRRFCILPTLNIYRRGLEQKVSLHSITIIFVGSLADGAYTTLENNEWTSPKVKNFVKRTDIQEKNLQNVFSGQ